ncbi:MAG: TIGR02530 family flagellar biosynthesis protein [Tissierellaceae bacterium]|jgi:flagellar operon protein
MSFRIERGHLITNPIPTRKSEVKGLEGDFKKVLDKNLEASRPVKISRHAEERMVERGIGLHEQDLQLIREGMDKLDEKGAKESLMLYKDMAFIASVKNRTIITAMGNRELDIVTNIDSAIVIK